jgi:hypothetical protein
MPAFDTLTPYSKDLENLTVTVLGIHLSWHSKVYYCVHNSLPLDHILSHMNTVHTFPTFCFKYILILSPLSPMFSARFPLGFPTKILYASLVSTCYMPHQSHTPWLHHPSWWRVQVLKLLIMQLSLLCSPSKSKYSPHQFVLKHTQPVFFL